MKNRLIACFAGVLLSLCPAVHAGEEEIMLVGAVDAMIDSFIALCDGQPVLPEVVYLKNVTRATGYSLLEPYRISYDATYERAVADPEMQAARNNPVTLARECGEPFRVAAVSLTKMLSERGIK